MKLVDTIRRQKKASIGKLVDERLKEFSSFKDKPTEEWFSELCFCLLTANSKAKTAMAIQKELGPQGFCNKPHAGVRACIIKHKHRFHNNKSRFIVEARDHIDIKQKIQSLVKKEGQIGAREWLVKNIKGLGYKEASHFLRNVGYFDLSILDRHILRVMHENKIISEIPKPISKARYLEMERKFLILAKKLRMSAAELDMYLFSNALKTGEVLK